jgi:hypothetical protein
MRYTLLIILLMGSLIAYSQDVLNYRIASQDGNKSLQILFDELEEKYPVRFFYKKEWLEGLVVPIDIIGLSLQDVVKDVFSGTDLAIVIMNSNSIVIIKDPARSFKRNEVYSQLISTGRDIAKIEIGNPLLPKKAIVALSGSVLEKINDKPLAGVSISINSEVIAITDGNGNFKLDMQPGSYILKASYLNFEDFFAELELYESGYTSIKLEESPTVLEEVTVIDKSSKESVTSATGQTKIVMKDVKRAPALMGEVDILKQIQTIAGVTTVSEAASGFNVRGGGVDQNLILYDGMPVFNSSHVFGFFSTFNAEAVRDATFYRGGIPAEYGGRASSVLDISSKEGDYDKWRGSAGIGFVSSNFLAEGPISKGKTSVLANVRTTYSDWILNRIRSNFVDLTKSQVSFYDYSIKLAHKFSDKSKLTMSWYTSSDRFRLSGDSTFSWRTSLGSFSFNQIVNSKLSLSLFAGAGQYQYKVYDDNELAGFNLAYSLFYPSVKADILWSANNIKVNAGINSTYYIFNPGTLTPAAGNTSTPYINIPKQRSAETALFVSSQFVLKNIYLDIGARLTRFRALGETDVPIYQAGVPKNLSSIIDTLSFTKGQTVAQYINLEPRFSFRWELNRNSSVKLGYNRLFQYLHLVTNTTAVTPVDVWQPSGYYFKPQYSDQLSLGYFYSLRDKTYEGFIEGYYKLTNNVLDFKDGAKLILNQNLEADLLQGKSRAYGIELQMAKVKGRFTGSVSYAYSRSFRTLAGLLPEESINGGIEYASNFDQPHVVNINWKNGLSRRFYFTGSFVYHTGRPLTLPLNAYVIDGITVTSFSERNQFRIPDYHRLDLGITLEGNHKRKKIFDGTWSISVYNVYGRKNAYSIYFKEARPGILRPYRLAIIGVALPSISYMLKF